jgi:hypothetical protein
MQGTMGESCHCILMGHRLKPTPRANVIIRYTYSLVFAADMYATIFKKDPLNPALGKLYRDKILLVGGSRDETDSLQVCHIFTIQSEDCNSRDGTGFPGSTTELRCILGGNFWDSYQCELVRNESR